MPRLKRMKRISKITDSGKNISGKNSVPYTYTILPYYGFAVLNNSGQQAPLSCNNAGPVSRGTITWPTADFPLGTLNVNVTNAGSGGGIWSVSGPGGYALSGTQAASAADANAPTNGTFIYTITTQSVAIGGTVACVSNAPISSCATLPLAQKGPGGSLGPTITYAFTIPRHGATNVYVRFEAAPNPVFTVSGSATQKLFTGTSAFNVTAAAPNAYVYVVSKKSGGAAEGNADDCATLVALGSTLNALTTDGNGTGAFTFHYGTDQLANAAAIGCWQQGLQIAGVPVLASVSYSAPIHVYAGTVKVTARVDNGGTSGAETMTNPPLINWTYGSPSTELCGASGSASCQNLNPIPYSADPMKGSGVGVSSTGGHVMTMQAPLGQTVSSAAPFYSVYPYANLQPWTNKASCGSHTLSDGPVSKITAQETLQTDVSTGCSGSDEGALEFNANFVNTRIKVNATITNAAGVTSPCETVSSDCGIQAATVGGTPSGNTGAGGLPGTYTITGPQTIPGNKATGQFWGMKSQ
jgi:hypothetical protein